MNGGATIEMECLICGESIKTSNVEWALRFDREHQAEHATASAENAALAHPSTDPDG